MAADSDDRGRCEMRLNGAICSYLALYQLQPNKALTVYIIFPANGFVTIPHITVHILHFLGSIPASRLFTGTHMLIQS